MDDTGSSKSRGPGALEESLNAVCALDEQTAVHDPEVPIGGEPTHFRVGSPASSDASRLSERMQLRGKCLALFAKHETFNSCKLKRLIKLQDELLSLEREMNDELTRDNSTLFHGQFHGVEPPQVCQWEREFPFIS